MQTVVRPDSDDAKLDDVQLFVPNDALPAGTGKKYVGVVLVSCDGRPLNKPDANAVFQVVPTVVPRQKVSEIRELRRFTGHADWVMAVAFSPDGRHAASGSGFPSNKDDNTARLWDLQSGKEIRAYRGHTLPIEGLAFTPDGRYLLTASHDYTLRLWNVETGNVLRKFPGHTLWIKCVAISADGRLAISGADDKTARIWDIKRGKEVGQLDGGVGVLGVSFLPTPAWPLPLAMTRSCGCGMCHQKEVPLRWAHRIDPERVFFGRPLGATGSFDKGAFVGCEERGQVAASRAFGRGSGRSSRRMAASSFPPARMARCDAGMPVPPGTAALMDPWKQSWPWPFLPGEVACATGGADSKPPPLALWNRVQQPLEAACSHLRSKIWATTWLKKPIHGWTPTSPTDRRTTGSWYKAAVDGVPWTIG